MHTHVKIYIYIWISIIYVHASVAHVSYCLCVCCLFGLRSFVLVCLGRYKLSIIEHTENEDEDADDGYGKNNVSIALMVTAARLQMVDEGDDQAAMIATSGS